MQPHLLKGNSIIVLNPRGHFNRDVILCLPTDKNILSLTLVGVTFSLL